MPRALARSAVSASPTRTAAIGLLCFCVVAAACAVLGTRPAAAQDNALTTVHLVAGPNAVQVGHTRWSPDADFVTGGRIVATGWTRRTWQAQLLSHDRQGSVSYRVSVQPGVYVVRVDLLAAVAQDRQTLTLEGRDSTVPVHPMGRGSVAGIPLAMRRRVTVEDHVLTVGIGSLPSHSGVAAISVVGLRGLPSDPGTTSPAPTDTPSVTPTADAPSAAPTPTTSSSGAPTTPTSTAPTTSTGPTTSPPTSASAGATVTPEAFGAVGDGHTDDTAALQATFDGADGRTVVLPAGHVYAHSGVLHLRTAGLHVTGPGELLATDESTSSVWIEADDVTVDGGVDIATASTTRRWSAWEQMGVRLDGHQGITLRNVTVEGSAAAGVYVGASTDFTLDHVTVRDTRADGIHMTDGSSDGDLIDPTVIDSGDDGIAVVSYQQDGAPCHDITVTSPTVRGTSGGRGLSVIGGVNVTETDIDVESTSAAAVYLGAEGEPWYTAAAAHVDIAGGRIVNANTDASTDHGAVVVISGESDVVPTAITVESLTIVGTRSTASRDLGVITYGTPPSQILFRDIAITGGPASAYQGNTPQSAYALRGITQNGTALPDAG